VKTSIAIALSALALLACPKKKDSAAEPSPSATAAPSASVAAVGTPDAAAAVDAAVASAAVPPPPTTPPAPAVVNQTPSEQDFEDKAESAITSANAASELSKLEREIGP
jgi:hypothetical protein